MNGTAQHILRLRARAQGTGESPAGPTTGHGHVTLAASPLGALPGNMAGPQERLLPDPPQS